jgi:tRNA pseudouridine38-40 synthase
VTAFRLVLEYDGTDFAGWQVQAGDLRTVQGCLEAAVAQVTGQTARVTGSGRTDAGVHARGQVANVSLETRFDAAGLLRALNGVLPRDLAVVDAAVVPAGFDARRDARSKLYVYSIWNAAHASPLRSRTHCWVPQELDLAAMSESARACTGRHDFTSFQTAGSDVQTTVRTVSRLTVSGESRGDIAIEVEGDGFLRHMVRNLAGTLIEVGRGRRSPDSMAAILAARDRRRAGPTAPARGLTLIRVCY